MKRGGPWYTRSSVGRQDSWAKFLHHLSNFSSPATRAHSSVSSLSRHHPSIDHNTRTGDIVRGRTCKEQCRPPQIHRRPPPSRWCSVDDVPFHLWILLDQSFRQGRLDIPRTYTVHLPDQVSDLVLCHLGVYAQEKKGCSPEYHGPPIHC